MPDRPIVLIAGGRNRDALYMGRALVRLLAFPKVEITAVVSKLLPSSSVIRSGSPVDHILALCCDDIVRVAGSPALVKSVEAWPARPRLLALPMLSSPAPAGEDSLVERIRKWIMLAPEPVGATR
jgi:hypothetical protein